MNYDLFKGSKMCVTQSCLVNGKSAVDTIYSKGHLLRLPFQYKNKEFSMNKIPEKGRYTLFYEFRQGEFIPQDN